MRDDRRYQVVFATLAYAENNLDDVNDALADVAGGSFTPLTEAEVEDATEWLRRRRDKERTLFAEKLSTRLASDDIVD